MSEVKDRPAARAETGASDPLCWRDRRRADGQRHRPCLRAGRFRGHAQRCQRRPDQGRHCDHQRQHGAPGRHASASPRTTARPRSAHRAGARISTTSADCDLVIEAATEKEEVKRQIFAKLCPSLKPEAIVATNTSSISITRLASSTDRPETLHRHSFHESGAADGAGRTDPRHRHRRSDLRHRPRPSSPSSARPSRSPRISRPSSSTASCCR